jgi:hypothetical protein
MEDVVYQIVLNPILHAKWLNTLSYLENCGARKIAGCEHPTKVKEEMLKHAAEEFRHAYYLKQQIGKICDIPMDTYSLDTMLGGFKSLHYLQALDLMTSRFLINEFKFYGAELKRVSYLLVTYAIELRAGALYPLYHKVLKGLNSKVHVKAIVLEEEEHLNDMTREIDLMENGHLLSKKVCGMEAELNQSWQEAIKNDVRVVIERMLTV